MYIDIALKDNTLLVHVLNLAEGVTASALEFELKTFYS